MHLEAAALALRHFPLIGWAKPACPTLAERIDEVARTARRADTDLLHEGAHALNMAALIASDCRLPDLATDLCHQHIDAYRTEGAHFTVTQARYQLEPVINLVRLRLRAADGQAALDLLNAMYKAAVTRTDFDVDGRTIRLSDLTGTREEYRRLLESVWLQLLGDGIRALVLAGRWDDAAAHARTHNGIGTRLMEGRQALVIARLLADDHAQAQAVLDDSNLIDPWEKTVASCLAVLCTTPDVWNGGAALDRMLKAFWNDRLRPEYIVFHTRAGLTVAALVQPTDPKAAALALEHVVDRALRIGDGYAAREILRHHRAAPFLRPDRQITLNALVEGAGLNSGAIPDQLRRVLLESAETAAAAVRSVVATASTST
ncbi:hypothetical protein [Actinocorallia populi]|uniref:hypothetical protein n=1 Tax=Actinocorallia populi TaxID=2079200 RepID=UPI000D088F53|nr:hypothetical protein [Actinocorallia populi]